MSNRGRSGPFWRICDDRIWLAATHRNGGISDCLHARQRPRATETSRDIIRCVFYAGSGSMQSASCLCEKLGEKKAIWHMCHSLKNQFRTHGYLGDNQIEINLDSSTAWAMPTQRAGGDLNISLYPRDLFCGGLLASLCFDRHPCRNIDNGARDIDRLRFALGDLLDEAPIGIDRNRA